jgi:hypothetical protein
VELLWGDAPRHRAHLLCNLNSARPILSKLPRIVEQFVANGSKMGYVPRFGGEELHHGIWTSHEIFFVCAEPFESLFLGRDPIA